MAPKKTTTQKRRRKTKSRRRGKKQELPVWKRNLLALLVVVIFSGMFYLFFIRPYAYRWKSCAGREGYGVCIPCDYEVHGIDISHYQGHIDWDVLAAGKSGEYPLKFVFLKATEGGDMADETFAQNFEKARQYGFVRGAYHYFLPKTDADRQADFFIKKVQLSAGDLPPVLDVEVVDKSDVTAFKGNVRRWLRRVEKHYGVKPIIYTSYKFKERYLSDPDFNLYPYWIAHYYVDAVRYKGTWNFWQHTDVGDVPGIEKKVDLNVFNGPYSELLNMTIH